MTLPVPAAPSPSSQELLPGFPPQPATAPLRRSKPRKLTSIKASPLAGCVCPPVLQGGGKRTRVFPGVSESAGKDAPADDQKPSLALLLFADYEAFAQRIGAYRSTLPCDPTAKSLDEISRDPKPNGGNGEAFQ